MHEEFNAQLTTGLFNDLGPLFGGNLKLGHGDDLLFFWYVCVCCRRMILLGVENNSHPFPDFPYTYIYSSPSLSTVSSSSRHVNW